MNKEILKQEIKKTGYLENVKIGCFFNAKYPHLVKEILEITKPIENSYFINCYLRARVKFLFDYDLDVNKIKSNNQWLTFDRKKDEFVDKTGDYRKQGWQKSKTKLSEEYYSKKKTIDILLKNDYYLKFLGKAKNRTLLKENPKLYGSIFEHTKFMDLFNKNNNKFSIRILVLTKYEGNKEKIKCKKCKEIFTTFNYEIFDFNNLCYDCFNHNNKNKYPQKGWFKNKYGKSWGVEYDKYLLNCYPTKSWFEKKYPLNWKDEYKKFNHENVLRLNNYNQGYSKISQKIFWMIYEKLTQLEKENTHFKELNNEWYVKNTNNFYFVDFKCGNKIIEFDGIYWHRNSKEKDEIRNTVYKNLGYQILIISENDLIDKKSKISDELINKCIKFLKNEN
jgi:very-short-patch-repair endonuclease